MSMTYFVMIPSESPIVARPKARFEYTADAQRFAKLLSRSPSAKTDRGYGEAVVYEQVAELGIMPRVLYYYQNGRLMIAGVTESLRGRVESGLKTAAESDAKIRQQVEQDRLQRVGARLELRLAARS